jgi:Zn-dependent protease
MSEQMDVPSSGQRGIDLFRAGRVQISIDYSWFVLFFLIFFSLAAGYFPTQFPGYAWLSYVLVGLVATLLFFASVLVHELSHAAVANSLGEDVRRISLFIFGGTAHLSGEPKNPSAELKIAAVGPVSSFVLAAGFWLTSGIARTVGLDVIIVAGLRYLAIINMALAVFNLLPGYPLDGGRLLRALFWQRSGSLARATARAAD